MKKRLLAVLLALCMTLALLPGMALAAENDGETTTPPTEDTDVPGDGEDTDIPDDGEDTDIPDDGEDTDTPDDGEDTDTPDDGEDTDTPDDGEDTDTPDDGEDTDTPPEADPFREVLTPDYKQYPTTLTGNLMNPDLIKGYGSAEATLHLTADASKSFKSDELIRALCFSINITGAPVDTVLPVRVVFPVPANIDWSETVLLHETNGYWETVDYTDVDRNNRTVSIILKSASDLGNFVVGELVSTDFINVLSSDNGSVIPSARRADPGERVSLYVHPDKGYELDTLTVTDRRGRTVALRSLGDNAYTFLMPAAHVTVEATFKAIKEETPAAGTTDPADQEFNSLGTPGISGIVLNPAAMPYTDVKGPDWFYNSVEYMWKHYLMSGVSATQFAPNATTNRGMIWTILARMNNVRTDINPGSTWYEKGMLWCKEQGITDGSDPLGDITREQLVTMLWRNSGKQGGAGDLSKFSDSADVSDYAVTAMRWAVGNGIINGENGKINPQGTATRAQVAAMVARYGDKIAR